MLIMADPEEFDAIVVGSGASGGWAAKRMSEAGMKVALVCAGRPLSDGDYREHVQPYELTYMARANDLIRRRRPVQKDCYACTEWNYDWFRNRQGRSLRAENRERRGHRHRFRSGPHLF